VALRKASKEPADPFAILARAPFLLLVIGLALRLAELGQKRPSHLRIRTLLNARSPLAPKEHGTAPTTSGMSAPAPEAQRMLSQSRVGQSSVVAAAGATAITKNGTTRRNLFNMAAPING